MAENYRRALTEEEIPSAFKNVYGNRTKKPISVQTAEIGMDVVSPLPTIVDIQKELDKKDPSYVKIAGLAGLELLGSAAPVVELAAKSANKSVLQKIVNYFKKNPGKEYNPESAKVSAKDLGFGEDVYHFTTSKEIKGDKFNPDLSIGNWNRMGIHVGAKKAAADRFRQTQGIDKYEDGKALTELSPGEYFEANAKGMTIPLKARTDKPLLFDGEIQSEFAIIGKLQEMAVKRGIGKGGDYATALRKELAEEGYTHIPYINEVENEGAISYIMLTDRPKKSSAVMRSRFADFDRDKVDKPELGLAEGGAMMRPEPRPDSVDISPRAEAGDQFFVEQAEKNKPFPSVKPKPRPDLDKNKGRTYDIYSVEIDGRETNVIEFKDGSRLSIPQIEQMFEGSKSATESTPRKQTTKEIINFLESNNPTREEFVKHFTAKRLNKGGAMMEEQMQMAFMNEGGLTDDGMDVDPVSGNDIPSGSMAEEVRDDIPAQLSDGEYVVPADVVRYYGVKFFEDLRDTAKMGLQDMEMNGRIGGEPVPDGGPINTQELSPQEMQALQEVMGMYGGGQVRGYQDSSLVTSNLTEQNMLDAGSAAQAENYVGSPLGFSIFGDSSTGVQNPNQQPETPTFTPITLYNTAGQTRTVNSEAEEKLARDDDFTMTLEQYNMYRSQRGGSGGTGGGSGIITPPGQGEDQEVKPWGQDLKDWNDVDDIKQFVAQAERGNLSGSGRFLRGAGFAIAGLPGAMLAGAFQSFKGLNGLYDIEAAQIIAEAKGKAGSKEHADLADKLKTDINTYLEKAGGLANFFYKPRSKNVMNKVNGVFVETGYEDVNSWAAGTRRTTVSDYKKGKGFDSKKSKQAGDSRKQKTRQAFNKLQKNKDSYIKSSTDSVQTAKNVADLEKSLSASSQNPSGTVSLNRGGLMQKKKKAKK